MDTNEGDVSSKEPVTANLPLLFTEGYPTSLDRITPVSKALSLNNLLGSDW